MMRAMWIWRYLLTCDFLRKNGIEHFALFNLVFAAHAASILPPAGLEGYCLLLGLGTKTMAGIQDSDT